MRQCWFKRHSQPNITQIVAEVRNLDCYKHLHNTKTAKQTIWSVLDDWSTYFRLIKAYKLDKTKLSRFPKPPGYKNKLAPIIFDKETISGGRSNKPLSALAPTNKIFLVKSDKKFKQVVVIPKNFGFVIEVQYECDTKTQVAGRANKDKVCTIDIGLNTLAAITYDQNRPILVNGRIVKSINQWYNKRPCKARSRKRYFRIQNYFHHASTFIVNLCVKHNVGRIIVERNMGWKRNITLGNKNNQAICCVPHKLFLAKIRYKAELSGIEVIFAEESYTSLSSFYDRDPLSYCNKPTDEFSGKRKHRGLYVTRDGYAINADVNGSLNIGRKVIPEFLGIRGRSLAARPVTVNPLKSQKCNLAG